MKIHARCHLTANIETYLLYNKRLHFILADNAIWLCTIQLFHMPMTHLIKRVPWHEDYSESPSSLADHYAY